MDPPLSIWFMGSTTFSLSLSGNASPGLREIDHWFGGQGFYRVEFENGRFDAVAYSMGNPIYHRLTERPGYTAYFREAHGGALLVFEVKLEGRRFQCEAYAPIQLFGFFPLKVSFKEKAGWITKYREQGWGYLQALKSFLSQISRS